MVVVNYDVIYFSSVEVFYEFWLLDFFSELDVFCFVVEIFGEFFEFFDLDYFIFFWN